MGNNYKKIAAILILILTQSCIWNTSRKDFYEDELAEYDLWRMPIIRPYEIVTSECCINGWTLTSERKNNNSFKGDQSLQGSIDSLFYSNGYIFFVVGSNHIRYGYMNIQTDSLVNLVNRNEFNYFLKTHKLTCKLEAVVDIYANWRKTKQLPWKVMRSR
jgi:hypothetical protein